MNLNGTVFGGTRLKRGRLDRGLTYRDVEQLSRVLSERYGDNRYIVRISVLARTENQGFVPNVFHLSSLSIIYSVEMRTVLSWYGLPDEPSRRIASRWLSTTWKHTNAEDFLSSTRELRDAPESPQGRNRKNGRSNHKLLSATQRR